MRRLFVTTALLLLESRAADTYSESLYLRQYADAHVLASFQFNLSSNGALSRPHSTQTTLFDADLLPRAIVQIIDRHSIAQLDLTLASGRWNYDSWGNPPYSNAPFGLEVSAWLYPSSDNEQDAWSSLANSLAGLFCASINRLDKSQISQPSLAYQPDPSLSNRSDLRFYRGLLPLEHPCTENLTPFTALLPCRSNAGLAQLLNPHKLFDASWQKLGVHLLSLPFEKVKIRLEVESVMDAVRVNGWSNNLYRQGWSLQKLYGREITANCPVATSSQIELHKPPQEPGLSIYPSPLDQEGLLDVQQAELPLNVGIKYPAIYLYPSTPAQNSPVTIKRVLAGYSQERGSIGVDITNLADEPVEAIYVEQWPWWIRNYLHTLRVEALSYSSHPSYAIDQIILSKSYTPAKDRLRSSLLQATLKVPANTTIRILQNYDKAYLRYTEYPPDAHRGFDVPSAVLQVGENRLYTTTTLITLPTPDFSMPFNVTILTCTVIALFFGTVFNALVRTFVIVDLQTEPEAEKLEEK